MAQIALLFTLSLIAVFAGISFLVQQAVNADLRSAIGSAGWAGFVSYLGGTLCMLLLALAMRDPLPTAGLLARANWWAWSGGLFGAIYIGISIMLVPKLGTASFVALLVAGQMLAALIADHYGIFGVIPHPVSAPRLLGAALLLGGAILIRR